MLGVAACGTGNATSVDRPTTVTLGFAEKIVTLDPDQAVDQTSLAALHLIDGNLYSLGRDGKVTPLLVESGNASPDGLQWTFNLKSGLTFSDGSPLTSADIAATFTRAKSDEANAYVGFVAPISSIDTPTPTTAIFHLSRPYPSLPVVLSQPEMTIYPAAKVDHKDFFNAPISAGPYALTSWGGGPTATLTRNSHYAGTLPHTARVELRTIADFNTRLAQVQSGQLDFAYDIPPSLLSHTPRSLTATLTPLYGFISIPLNNSKPPLNEAGVRRAISAAIDRQQINQTIWNGKSVPLAGFWPSTLTGYDPSIPTTPDVAAAKSDLAGTSCAHGCTVSLLYSSADTWADPMAQIIAQNLARIGITVKLDKVDDATVNQRLGDESFQLAETFLYDYNDVPDGLLTYALTTDGGLNANFTGFRPPPELRAAVTAAITRDGSARADALAEVTRLFRQYQPFVTVLTHVVGTVSRLPHDAVSLDSGGFVDVG
ncbi:MAG: ABC transporter substrate-binding protein [Jatrophihabitantaceae bacterium]